LVFSRRRKTKQQAIVRDPIYQTNIGPRYSLCTLTIGNTYVCLLIYHYPTSTIGFNWSLPNLSDAGNNSRPNFTANLFLILIFYGKFKFWHIIPFVSFLFNQWVVINFKKTYGYKIYFK
jgi:hypothetical protein